MIPDVLRAPKHHQSPAIAGTAVAVFWGADGQTQNALGILADYSATVSSVKTITFKKGTGSDRSGVLTVPTLSRGGNFNVASTAFEYAIESVTYGKAAVTAGTALAAGTIPTNKWGIYRLSINAAGTITVTAGAANFTTGYDDEAAAIAALPSVPAGGIDMGYVAVLTAVGSPFVGGTDALQGGAGGNPSSDTNYYPATSIAPSTEDMVLRWDFSAGPCYLPLPGVLKSARSGSYSAELESSGGSETGRITLMGCVT